MLIICIARLTATAELPDLKFAGTTESEALALVECWWPVEAHNVA